MARSRNIKPGFFANEYLAELSPHARLLFIGLWTLADREGRLEWRPKKIKAALFPYEDVDICALMDELEACPDRVLFRYGPGSAQAVPEHNPSNASYSPTYIQITNWHEHQRPYTREAESKIPAPEACFQKAVPEHDPGTTQARPEQCQGSDESVPSCSDSGFLIPDSGFLIPDSPGTNPGTAPPQNLPQYPAGWEPTAETRDNVEDLLHRIEGILGVWPLSSKQIGNGEANVIREELAAILRLLTVEEVAEIVRREMEARVKDTKGADRPVNLKWYMRPIKDAFFARDRQLAEEERSREEAKKQRGQRTDDGPVQIGDLIEEELTEEDRAKMKERFKEVRAKMAGAGQATEVGKKRRR